MGDVFTKNEKNADVARHKGKQSVDSVESQAPRAAPDHSRHTRDAAFESQNVPRKGARGGKGSRFERGFERGGSYRERNAHKYRGRENTRTSVAAAPDQRL